MILKIVGKKQNASVLGYSRGGKLYKNGEVGGYMSCKQWKRNDFLCEGIPADRCACVYCVHTTTAPVVQ
jgi:hypothetical protein